MNGTTKQIEFASQLIARNTKRFDAMRAEVKAIVAECEDVTADESAKILAFASALFDDIQAIMTGDDAAAIIDMLTGSDSAKWGCCKPKTLDADTVIYVASYILTGDKRGYMAADAARFAR